MNTKGFLGLSVPNPPKETGKFPARLHVLLARGTKVGLVIRRGPSKSVCTVLWNRERDTFKLGQWNHACIHQNVAENLGAQVLFDLENHHNFAWKEKHVIDGVEREVVVHRKGATPAGNGVLGIIPGSMASPGFVVSGKGNRDSLNSASHGAGRAMSRKAANEKFNWKDVNRLLRERGVTLISAGLDEVPMAYKNIREVMAAQSDLVTVLGQFDPKLVKMAPSGERPED